MNNFTEKSFEANIPIKYLCEISYNSTGKKIFIYSSDKFFSLEGYRDELEKIGALPVQLKIADTVVFGKDTAYLIEFKSGKYDNISSKDLKNQFLASKEFFNYIENHNINKFYCILVIEKFVYGISENIKRLMKKHYSSRSFLRERINIVNSDIKNNGMDEIRVLTTVDFIKEFNISLCDVNNTCDNKPSNNLKCKFKDLS